MAHHHGVPTITGQKSWDILKLVGMEPNKRMYIINLPKASEKGIGRQDLYNALESMKDGNFTVTKGADVKRVLMNPPHIWAVQRNNYVVWFQDTRTFALPRGVRQRTSTAEVHDARPNYRLQMRPAPGQLHKVHARPRH